MSQESIIAYIESLVPSESERTYLAAAIAAAQRN
jgi:hypothetical protein